MSADWAPPGYLRNFSIELRARQYRDPIQKLAYLRRTARKSRSNWKLSWRWKMPLFLLVFLLIGARVETVTEVKAGLPREKRLPETSEGPGAPVLLGQAWLVEHGPDHDVYSNGLRIENRFLAPNEPRSYVIFRNGSPSERRSKPAGIVFHTSESAQVPFAADENDTLTRIGRDLLEYISRKQAYHFVIDRFGRVFRIVPETDVANHAGNSVWADQEGVYLNLNHSFLGVSFEAHTRTLDEGPYLTSSQIHSGHLLVEMLVGKYDIPLRNCVTHAQVSVDPTTMTIGYHTDGSGSFPFKEIGIPNNYELPVPSMFLFGFDFDSRFLMLAGTRMWKGMLLADEQLRREADSQHLPLGQYKENLREKYRTSIAMLKSMGIIKEN